MPLPAGESALLPAVSCVPAEWCTLGHQPQVLHIVRVAGPAGDTEADFNEFENENVAAANPDVVKACLVNATKHWAKKNTATTTGIQVK
jgi:hypothetical protein